MECPTISDSKTERGTMPLTSPTSSDNMDSISCPKCGSSQFRRSKSQGPYEKFLKKFNIMAYRCKECGWRGTSKGKNLKGRNNPLRKGHSSGKLILVAVVLLITIYILIYIVKGIE
jgi:predicted RNA-binding Zn-ribbon protein involved in translation (DUF1610 family)